MNGYYRISINLVAFTWNDIKDHIDLLKINDEIDISVYIPERTGHHHIISGRALYVHAAFTPQRRSFVDVYDEQEILKSYRELAISYFQ